MLQNKSTQILSEIENFFASGEKGILKIIGFVKMLNLSNIKFGGDDLKQAKYHKSEIILILLLFPLFSVKNVSRAMKNQLSNYLDAKKDVYYRFKNNSSADWRKVVSTVNKRILKKVNEEKNEDTDAVKCLIIDDTDLPKTGFKIEHIGKIWSHVIHRRILGFKGLFIGYWDGKSFFGLDFSLHKEKGKNKRRPFGLSPKQLKNQYTKKTDRKAAGKKRIAELTIKKTDNAIALIKRALRRKMEVSYILTDSWFVNDNMIKFVKSIKSKVDLIGMLKNGNSKYTFNNKELTAKQIADILKRRKKVKLNKTLNMYAGEAVLIFKGSEIKVFFCKTSKRGKWHLLMSTDTKLSILRAYKIYSIRWSIEVFFKESKQYFGLGKSQSRDFDAQIADISINIIQYNLLSLGKRFLSYETMGQLFRNLQESMLELIISQKV
jgi:hypothetical protein